MLQKLERFLERSKSELKRDCILGGLSGAIVISKASLGVEQALESLETLWPEFGSVTQHNALGISPVQGLWKQFRARELELFLSAHARRH